MTVVSKILNVWCENFESTMRFLDGLLNRFNVLSIDTEFPGFLRNTPRNAPAVESYSDLKFNVDCTDLIQLGVTLSDNQGKISYTFEFNFSDFDLKKGLHADDSIQLLKDSGLDFDKIRTDGIARCVFAPRFLEVHAGSDSLLTAAVFAEMNNRYDLEESVFDGFLYGMDSRIEIKPHRERNMNNLLFDRVRAALKIPNCHWYKNRITR